MIETNYFLPPEWAEQKSVWLSWPHNKETWTADELTLVEQEYAVFVRELSEVVPVQILILDQQHEDSVGSILGEIDNVFFHQIVTNDAWMRDHGPDFVWNKDLKAKMLLDWEYNSWGGKYPPFQDDNNVPNTIAEKLDLTSLAIDVVLEGGSFEVNGEGDLLTTKSCLLNPNRNPHLTQDDIEQYLKYFFGIQNVLWLEEGISGDDTDGHIDDFARFVNKNTIVYASTTDESHPDYQSLKRAEQDLKELTLLNGETPNLVKLPMPKILEYKGEVLPCSYANFLITNKKVLVPIFNCDEDQEALEVLQTLYLDRKIVGIPSNNIIIGLGSLHCLSKQEFDESRNV